MKEKKHLASSTSKGGPSKYDYLHLLEGIGETNLLKRVWFQKNIQGNKDRANNLVDYFLKTYDGHPYFHLYKANILYSIFLDKRSATDKAKSILVKDLQQNALKGLVFAGRQDPFTKQVADIIAYIDYQVSKKKIKFVEHTVHGEYVKKLVSEDFPPDSSYLIDSAFFNDDERLVWTQGDCFLFEDIINNLLSKQEKGFNGEEGKRINDILKANQNRFRGNPSIYQLQAKVARNIGKTNGIEDVCRQGIKENALAWNNYWELGSLYTFNGEYKRAKELFMSFPLFGNIETKYNKVGLSNQFSYAGTRLYRVGAYEEARPFYEFCAKLDTGSEGSIKSKIRLSLLDRDFTSAAFYSQQRARRYNSKYAYRDYITLLHLMEMSDVAWPLFDSLLGRFKSPEIWTSAFVGLRLNGTTRAQLRQWLEEKKKLNNSIYSKGFLSQFAMLNLIDREPEMSDAELVTSFDFPANTKFDKKESSQVLNALGQKPNYSAKLITQEEQTNIINKDGAIVPFNGAFAKIYVQIKGKNYNEAFQASKKLSAYYDFSSHEVRQIIPYVILAGVKSGNEKEARIIIDQDLLRANDFDMLLALAVLKGLQGSHDEALELLKKAFNHRPNTERLLFSWYQILEVCEWLFEESNDKRYVDLIVKWSKDYQVTQPMFAYAFAFEAKYTDKPERQLQALAFAQYLDQDSARISHFSKELKTKAAKWMTKNNPFTSESNIKSTSMNQEI